MDDGGGASLPAAGGAATTVPPDVAVNSSDRNWDDFAALDNAAPR